MPTISHFYGIKIRMHYDEKHGPHFHVHYAEFRAQISIADGLLMAGALPVRAYHLVLEWLALHHHELLDNWERARRGEPLHNIEGLG